ncbi:MAG: hypothetical protein AB9903_11355 [Vulcanimicrobiota bacterium]
MKESESPERIKMTFLDKVLASVCTICPLCILKRRFPDSAFSRFIEKVEKCCPFCNAYRKNRNSSVSPKILLIPLLIVACSGQLTAGEILKHIPVH